MSLAPARDRFLGSVARSLVENFELSRSFCVSCLMQQPPRKRCPHYRALVPAEIACCPACRRRFGPQFTPTPPLPAPPPVATSVSHDPFRLVSLALAAISMFAFLLFFGPHAVILGGVGLLGPDSEPALAAFRLRQPGAGPGYHAPRVAPVLNPRPQRGTTIFASDLGRVMVIPAGQSTIGRRNQAGSPYVQQQTHQLGPVWRSVIVLKVTCGRSARRTVETT